jgi:hypothetical protein
VFSFTVITTLLTNVSQQRTFLCSQAHVLTGWWPSHTNLLLFQLMSQDSAVSQSQSYVTTDGQSASLSWCQAPVWGPRPDFYYCQTVAVMPMWGALADERTRLSFTMAAGLRQRSHSRVRVPRDSWPYFTVSDSRLPQPGGPGPRIYIPQEQGGPVITPGTGFPFRRLLRLAGLRWRYSNPPQRGVSLSCNDSWSLLYSLGTNRTESISSNICVLSSEKETCPQSCSPATAVVLSLVYTAFTWK